MNEFETRLRAALSADAERLPLRVPPAFAPAALRPRRLPRPWVLAAPALAALAAALILVAGSGTPPSAIAATPPMLQFQGGGGDAGAVLARLRRRTAALPTVTAKAGGYVFQRQQSWALVVAVSGGSARTSVLPVVQETWSDRGGPRLRLEGQAPPIATGRLTAAEEAAARRGEAVKPLRRARVGNLGKFATLDGLSRRPRELFRQLAAPLGFGPARMSDPLAVGHAMGFLSQYLVYSSPTQSFLRALDRMLALIPGVTNAGRVTDRAGRPGLAVAVNTDIRGERESFRLIFDPATGALNDLEHIQLTPLGTRIPVPYVSEYQLFFPPKLVDRLGAR